MWMSMVFALPAWLDLAETCWSYWCYRVLLSVDSKLQFLRKKVSLKSKAFEARSFPRTTLTNFHIIYPQLVVEYVGTSMQDLHHLIVVLCQSLKPKDEQCNLPHHRTIAGTCEGAERKGTAIIKDTWIFGGLLGIALATLDIGCSIETAFLSTSQTRKQQPFRGMDVSMIAQSWIIGRSSSYA